MSASSSSQAGCEVTVGRVRSASRCVAGGQVAAAGEGRGPESSRGNWVNCRSSGRSAGSAKPACVEGGEERGEGEEGMGWDGTEFK